MFINDFTVVFLFLYCWDCASIWVRQTSTWRKKRCLVILEKGLVLKWKHIFRFCPVCKKKKEKEKKAGFNKYLIFVDATKAASVTLVSEAYNCERQSLTDGWVTKVCFFSDVVAFEGVSNTCLLVSWARMQTLTNSPLLFVPILKVRLCTQTWAVIKVRGKC